MRYLIINADDFGYSKIFNQTILELIEKDFISSTSVMVDWINDEQKHQVQKLIELSRTHNISIGLHIDFKNTNFDEEIQRQHNVFKKIFGFEPIHIDLHKSVYLCDGYPHIINYSKQKNIPCKNLGVKPFTNFMTKEINFYGTKKEISEIENWLSILKDGQYYVIVFHPGKYDPDSKSSFNEIREVDTKHIVKLNNLLSKYDIKLASYSDFINTL